MTKFIYVVYRGEEIPQQFDDEVLAMEYARAKGNATVEKTEVDEDGTKINSEVIFETSEVELEEPKVEENELNVDFPESDINEINGHDDEEFGTMWEPNDFVSPADWDNLDRLPNLKEAVDALEENEDEVECKCCFELGPKAEMKKLDIGYVCPKCAQEMQSHQGTNLDLIDKDPFDLEYDDPRTYSDEEAEPLEFDEPVNADEVRKHERVIGEDLKVITDFSSYKPWSGAVDTYELIRDAGKLEDLESYLEDCYPEGINETQLNDILWFDEEQILKDLGLGDVEDDEEGFDECVNKETFEALNELNEDTKKVYTYICDPSGLEGEVEATSEKEAYRKVEVICAEKGIYVPDEIIDIAEKIEEHIQDRPAPVENEQELQGMDNAVVDCQTDMKVIAHSEDEKPLDCKMEKAPLEKPLTEETVEEAKKDEEEIPADPEYVKLEVHNTLNDLVADEIEAINGYEEAKADILDAPIEHKDEIVSTIDHIEDEEKEHIDELIDATSEIPFEGEHKEEAPVIEETPAEEPIEENSFDQEFPEVEEKLEERAMAETPFDSDAKVGDKIRIIHLEDENSDYDGKEGTVDHIDSLGQLHGDWGGLAVIPGVDNFEIITEELTEAKEEGDKVKSYNDGLKLAKVHNKPVIYGYTNKTLNGKFFALDDPIICDKEEKECEKAFRSQYKNCGQIYVAYPDKDFAESLETLKEYWWEDNDPMNQVDQEEDNVECGWCHEIYPESDCRYEKDFGYLCSQCEAELKSHGEQLVFVEPAPKK